MIRAAFTLLLLAPLAVAQVPREGPPVADPPPELPGGRPVSRPIQPVLPEVQEPPQALPPAETVIERPVADRRRHWLSIDYLMAWTRNTTLPTVATANAFGMPALGDPNTVPLLGGPQSRGAIEGMRFVYGRWNDEGPKGWEVAYQFVGSRTDTAVLDGGGVPGEAILGRPLYNPRTGREDGVLISHPNMIGHLAVSQTIRLQGWEVTALREVFANEWGRVTALAGYRYFMLNEGLRFDQRSESLGQPVVGTGVATYRTASADQFDAHNRFHGGTLGLRTQLDYNGFFAQVDTKVSLGRTTEVVKASGQTVSTIDSPGGLTISHFPNGVFGQPSNTGRTARGVFAVLPEANLRVGYSFNERARFFVGYQFSYLSDVVRAADQLDRVVDLPGPADPLALVPLSVRPRVPFARTDFWVQGVTLGLEWRY